MRTIKHMRLLILGIVTASIGTVYVGSVFASHNFEAGVQGNNIPDNTHINLSGITLPHGGVMPVYDASPNFIAGHFLLRAPCEPVALGDDTYRPTVTVIAGHIDEKFEFTHMEKVPLFYIKHASFPDAPVPANSCVWHAHIPDPLNGGSPRVTDIDLVNLSGSPITFNPGDVVDINVQRVLGSMANSPYTGADGGVMDIAGFNPIFDLNDEDDTNDGLGFHGGE